MRIAFFSAQPYEQEFFDRKKTSSHELCFYPAALTDVTVALVANGADAVCCFVNDSITARVIEGLASYGVRLILMRCAGYNNVDLQAAKAAGIVVGNVPAYSPEAIAEHTLALIMTINRKTHRAYNRVREGNFDLNGLMGRNMHGKTAGIVGTGRIGLACARILRGFGCHVLGYDQYESDAFRSIGGQYVSLEHLLSRSDIVSLHCPSTEATRHLINNDSLRIMKKGALLVNTSRGDLIDTKAVIRSLKMHHLGSLAIDVYEAEAGYFYRDGSQHIIQDDTLSRLMTFPNVLITGHQAFFTEEALHEIALTTLQNADAFEQTGLCKHTISM